jgi:chromosome segregation ATPase
MFAAAAINPQTNTQDKGIIMAKKKGTKSKKAAPRATKKKVAKAKSRPSTAASKSTKKPKTSAPKQSNGAVQAKPSRATSVDSILKKFKKERVTLDTGLVTVRKKINELNAKTRAFEEQIAKLTEKELVTEEAIEQLDARRDAEVSELLSKLGVKLGSSQEEVTTSSSPFAVLLPNKGDSSSSDDDEGDQSEDESDS